MNRRQFLSFASVPIAASVVVPELLRTIILPPRGGWPTLVPSRFLGCDMAGGLDATGLLPTVGNRVLTAAQFRQIVSKDLNKFWCDYYDGKILGQDGEPIRFAEEWRELYEANG